MARTAMLVVTASMVAKVSMVAMASMVLVDPVALSGPWELLVETHAMASTVETALMVASSATRFQRIAFKQLRALFGP